MLRDCHDPPDATFIVGAPPVGAVTLLQSLGLRRRMPASFNLNGTAKSSSHHPSSTLSFVMETRQVRVYVEPGL